MSDSEPLLTRLDRLIALLERLAPADESPPDFASADAFLWEPDVGTLRPVAKVNRVDLAMLKGIDNSKRLLLENTQRFAGGFPANNALLWGARGMGKSSLVKAVHGELLQTFSDLKLVEVHREDIATLPRLMRLLSENPYRFIVFCDDLSFETSDADYKSLKAALEGGIDGRPENTLFYATSNRRHLMPRDMLENERSTAVTPGEAVEEKVSLSDRFGLWLGFHSASQNDYLSMVRSYAAAAGIKIDQTELDRQALEWATTRGARSGRVAWQFITDLAGRLGVRLS